jgi:uncharacterized protein (TIGR03435 family)
MKASFVWLCLASVILASPDHLMAQTQTLHFEVASVKLDQSSGGRGLPRIDSERLSWSGATLKRMICEAYNIHYAQVLGAPAWTDTERYEVNAKAERPSTRDEFRQMLQSLLTDRFKSAFQRQTKTMPVYALTVAQSGLVVKEIPPAQPNQPDDKSPVINQLHRRASMEQLAGLLSDMMSGPIFNGYTGTLEAREDAPAMVLDKTGLTGVYDIKLSLSGSVDGDIASNLEASLRALGLRLELKRVPVETLVVTRVERVPTAN